MKSVLALLLGPSVSCAVRSRVSPGTPSILFISFFATSSWPRFVIRNFVIIKSYPHTTTRTMTHPQPLVCVVIPIAVMNLLQGTNAVPVLFSFFDANCVHKEYKSNRLLHLNSQFPLKITRKFEQKGEKNQKKFLCKIIVRKMAKTLLLGGDHYWGGYTV